MGDGDTPIPAEGQGSSGPSGPSGNQPVPSESMVPTGKALTGEPMRVVQGTRGAEPLRRLSEGARPEPVRKLPLSDD
jgi:hypothetical protein